jgi:hypothetical protein
MDDVQNCDIHIVYFWLPTWHTLGRLTWGQYVPPKRRCPAGIYNDTLRKTVTL